MVSTSCPDENALAELVQGLADDVIAGELEQHLDGCQECRRIVSAVGQSSYLAQRRTRVDSERSGDAHVPTTAVASDHEQPVAPDPGTILAGKYRVEGILGQGGMGVVLAATHLTLHKLVALKLMRTELARDAGAAQRFVREARAASLLRSEHIVRVIDLDTLDDGSPYMAMEYLEGTDLGAELARRGRIPANEAATYILHVCDAIGEAHAAGIVHRDLKPANLFLTQRAGTPCVKVLDFGVSKIIAGGPLIDNAASTDTKSLVGSPHYMAPEQLLSAKAVDPRTDIWALGCILYELVSGVRPFASAEALAQVLASILRDNVPALHVPDLPDGFARVVERCLEKDPARRYQRVEELASDLAGFLSPRRPTEPAPRLVTHAQVATALGIGTPSSTPRAALPQPVRKRTRGRLLVLAFASALALAAAGGFVAYRAGDAEAPAAAQISVPDLSEPIVIPERASSHVEAAPSRGLSAPSRAAAKKPAPHKLEDDLIGPSFD